MSPCSIIIYDPCPKCDAPLNPYHQKNGCEEEIEIFGCDKECGKDSTFQDMYGNNYCSVECRDNEEEEEESGEKQLRKLLQGMAVAQEKEIKKK